MTGFTLPAWIPPWEFLLTLALIWYLVTQVVAVFLSLMMVVFAIGEQHWQLVRLLGQGAAALVMITVVLTLWLSGWSI